MEQTSIFQVTPRFGLFVKDNSPEQLKGHQPEYKLQVRRDSAMTYFLARRRPSPQRLATQMPTKRMAKLSHALYSITTQGAAYKATCLRETRRGSYGVKECYGRHPTCRQSSCRTDRM